MTPGPTLAEQRLALRGQLRARREDIALQLFASKVSGTFPRSITMRVLIHRPELVGWLVAWLAGARVGGAVSALLVGARLLGSFSTVTARRVPEAPAGTAVP